MDVLILTIVVSLIWGCLDWLRSVDPTPAARPVVPAQVPATPPTAEPCAETPPATPTRPATPPADPVPTPSDPPADPLPTAEPTADVVDDDGEADPEADDGPDDDVDDDCDDTIDDPDDDPPAPGPGITYDSDRCWGCAKGCTYRGFRIPGGSTADAIHRAASRAYRAEHGYDNDVDAADGDCGDWSDLAGTPSEFSPIEIARRVGVAKRSAWFDMVDQCSAYCATETAAGRDPWRPVVVDSASVDAEPCPF